MTGTAWRRAKRGVRWVLTRATRPTYSRSLDFVAGRDELPGVLNSRGLLGTGVEVGVNKGEYSELILERWRGRKLISVDSWSEAVNPTNDFWNPSQEAIDGVYEEACRRLGRFGERSEVRRTTSLEAAARFGEHSLDFVYIDAAHEYRSVQDDIAAWWPTVRPGGLLCGHDYYDGPRDGIVYGVATAVDEHAERERLAVGVTLRDQPERTWMIRRPAGT